MLVSEIIHIVTTPTAVSDNVKEQISHINVAKRTPCHIVYFSVLHVLHTTANTPNISRCQFCWNDRCTLLSSHSLIFKAFSTHETLWDVQICTNSIFLHTSAQGLLGMSHSAASTVWRIRSINSWTNTVLSPSPSISLLGWETPRLTLWLWDTEQ